MTLLAGERYRWVPHNRWDLVAPPPPREPGTSVAVIVTYFEQPESLGRMYGAIGAAGLDPSAHELIVVDDGSIRPPPGPPEGFALATRILRQPDRGCRPGAARNLGASSTDADVLVFFDADTLPETTTVGRLSAWPAILPDALVVGRRGHVDLAGWTPDATTAWLQGEAPAPPRGDDPRWLDEGYRATRDLLDADDRSYRYVISAVMACHRSLYDDIGGFDAERCEYGSDDWEFAFRAFNHGAVLIHDPSATAWHDEPDWAGRDGRLAARNSQALYMARAAPEPLTRGPGLIQPCPDTIVRLTLRPRATDAQVVATVQSLLAAISDVGIHIAGALSEPVRRHLAHDPRVHLGPPSAEAAARCRTVVDLEGPAHWTVDGLRSTVDAVRPGGPGLITVDAGGAPLATVASTRALGRARRARRLGHPGLDEHACIGALFGHETRPADVVGLRALRQDVDLAGYFGGWSEP